MPRINPKWELAAEVAREMSNDTDANIKRILAEFKAVRTDADRLGFDDEDVVSCWRWLRTREDFPIDQARISTVLRGSPCYLTQWEASVKESMPPVWDIARYDDWIRQNARWLQKRRWKYSWPDEFSKTNGSRMTLSEAESLGVA